MQSLFGSVRRTQSPIYCCLYVDVLAMDGQLDELLPLLVAPPRFIVVIYFSMFVMAK